MSLQHLTEHEARCKVRYENAERLVDAINQRSYLQYRISQGVAYVSWSIHVRQPNETDDHLFITTSAQLAINVLKAVAAQADINPLSTLI